MTTSSSLYHSDKSLSLPIVVPFDPRTLLIVVSSPHVIFILYLSVFFFFFFFQAEDGIRDVAVTGVQTCALPISAPAALDEGGPAPRRLEPAPHLARQLHAERQLRLLVVDRDLVALDGRGEAALRAQADLLDRHVLGRLIEAPLEVVLPLEGADLGGHQPQDHAHVFGDEPERREVARAGVVELEEEAVVWQLVEDGLGDPGVAALGAPARPEVAAEIGRAHV